MRDRSLFFSVKFLFSCLVLILQTTPMGKPEMVMMSDLGLMSFRDGMKFSHDLRACPSDLARWHGVSVDLIVSYWWSRRLFTLKGSLLSHPSAEVCTAPPSPPSSSTWPSPTRIFTISPYVQTFNPTTFQFLLPLLICLLLFCTLFVIIYDVL